MNTRADALRAVATAPTFPQPNQATASLPAVFNADAWHAMQSRDDQLIRDAVLHGYAGKEYVYKFSIAGNTVTGVSVVGARELAAHYGGIKTRIVASVDKTGSLFVFKSFEPLSMQAQMIPQLMDQEDFYEVVMEVTDIKSGNSIQVRKKETKVERKRDGTTYDRPHYDVIAESKAYRNGVLSIIPQNVIQEFEARCLKAGNSGQEKTIDQLREGAMAFAAKNSISLDRHAVAQLTYAQILGLGNSVKDGIAAFRGAAVALEVMTEGQQEQARLASSIGKDEPKADPKVENKKDARDADQTGRGEDGRKDQDDPPAQDPTQRTASAPLRQDVGFEASLADVAASIKTGDMDTAADLARGLSSAEDRTAAEGMIKSARSVRENPPAARGRRPALSME